jgi:hypothetical protein
MGLNVEMRRGGGFPEFVERRASRIGGALLFGLAAYVVVSAVYGLWMRRSQEFSAPGLALTALAIPITWWLAKAKCWLTIRSAARRSAPMPSS